MVPTAAILILLTLVAMATGPFIGYAIARRRNGRLSRRLVRIHCAYSLVVAAAIAIALLLAFSVLDQFGDLQEFLAVVLAVVMFTLPFGGPWLGAYLIHAARAGPRPHCARCDYDLTGNASGVCPECGTRIQRATAAQDESGKTSAAPQATASPWPRAGKLWITGIAVLTALAGVQQKDELRYCTRCAQSTGSISYQWVVPFQGQELVSTPNWKKQWQRTNPLTRFLDPRRTCQHVWASGGSGCCGVTTGATSFGYSNPAQLSWADRDDFSAFLDEHPNVLDEIRKRLPGSARELRNYVTQVKEMYIDWVTAGCPCCHATPP